MFSFFTSYQDSTLSATRQLLRALKVKVSHTTLKETLEEHPDYPSLLSIVDSLSGWKVETMGVKVTSEQLLYLPTPFLAHFKSSEIVPVIATHEETIIAVSTSGRETQINKEDFLKQWDNIVLLAEAGEKSGESEYSKKHRLEILRQICVPGAFIIAFILTILTGITTFHTDGIRKLFPLLVSLVMLSGVGISSLLLWYEIDNNNPVLQKICTAGKRTDCSAILQSGAAKLWGTITWSEIGFAYFTGGFLSLLLSDFNPVIMGIVAWLNLLTVPYIFFSVFYQWRVAKQWCVLCLSIQSLLLAGFITCLIGKFYTLVPENISMQDVTLLAITYLLSLFSWRQIKPLWLNAKSGKHYKLQLLRLKRDKRIFEALLPKQKSISSEEIQCLGITLGNPKAKHKLVKACNPYCSPCARAHPEIEKIVETYPNISAKIIFTATDDEKDKRSYPVKHLMAIDEKGDKRLTKSALDYWYNAVKKDYDLFASKYPLNGELQQQGGKLKAMSEWCEKTGISFTPTFFVSLPSSDTEELRQLPDIYSAEDLKYLLV